MTKTAVSGHPRSEMGQPGVDQRAARIAVRDLLKALGCDPDSEHLRETPRRVAEAYHEMLTPRPFNVTTFPNDEKYDELVLAKEIHFRSLCEHHMLPFHGRAHVGYFPGDRIVGLSKLARIVESFACRLQVQERMTKQIADWLVDNLEPRGVGVVVEAEHTCMTMRGVHAIGSRTVTSTLYGLPRENASSRAEFFALTGVGRQ